MASTWAAAGLSDECPAALVIDDERLARLDGILNLSSNEPSSCESSFNKGSEKGRLARSLSFGETPPVDLDAYEEAESIRMRRSSDTADAVRSWNGPFSVLGAAFKSPVDPDDATSDSFTALDGFRKQAKPESPIFSVLRHASVHESGGDVCATPIKMRRPSRPRASGVSRSQVVHVVTEEVEDPRREAAAAFDDFDQVWAGLPPSTNVSPNLIACFDEDDHVQEPPLPELVSGTEDLSPVSVSAPIIRPRSTSVDAAAVDMAFARLSRGLASRPPAASSSRTPPPMPRYRTNTPMATRRTSI